MRQPVSVHDVHAFFDECHPRLSEGRTYYLKHPAMLSEDQAGIERLNHQLWLHHDVLSSPALVNQRSYQLFGHEKFLKGAVKVADYPTKERDKRLYRRLRLSSDVESLNYVLPSPVPVARWFESSTSTSVLIVENQDTYWSVLTLLESQACPVFKGLIWGAGKQVEASFLSVSSGKLGTAWCDASLHFLYAGDLDVEGILIYLRLIKRYPSYSFNYLPGYGQALVEKSKQSGWREGNQNLTPALVEALLHHPERESLLGEKPTLTLGFWQGGFMLPQEVMTQSDWRLLLAELECGEKLERLST